VPIIGIGLPAKSAHSPLRVLASHPRRHDQFFERSTSRPTGACKGADARADAALRAARLDLACDFALLSTTYTPPAATRRGLRGWIGQWQQAWTDQLHAEGDAFARVQGWEIRRSTGRFGFVPGSTAIHGSISGGHHYATTCARMNLPSPDNPSFLAGEIR
jgi:hypothetical protein